MKDSEPQPWHEADEKPAAKPRGHAPIGTHSLTGGGAEVGMPPRAEDAERSVPDVPGAEEPDPLKEPRADVGRGILGPKP
jgi:hypothetical protein